MAPAPTHRRQPAQPPRALAATAAAIAALDPAAAHTGAEVLGGLASGFEHPLFGFDHLLAMLAVGIWGAQIGGRAVWSLPTTFPLIMAAGGLAGMAGLPLPSVETGIALSLLVFGLVIALAWRPFELAALALIAIFAIFHGYAHGAELPSAVDPAAYSAGFVLATGLIHVVGIFIGLLSNRIFDGWLSRGLGGAIAAGGVYFLLA